MGDGVEDMDIQTINGTVYTVLSRDGNTIYATAGGKNYIITQNIQGAAATTYDVEESLPSPTNQLGATGGAGGPSLGDNSSSSTATMGSTSEAVMSSSSGAVASSSSGAITADRGGLSDMKRTNTAMYNSLVATAETAGLLPKGLPEAAQITVLGRLVQQGLLDSNSGIPTNKPPGITDRTWLGFISSLPSLLGSYYDYFKGGVNSFFSGIRPSTFSRSGVPHNYRQSNEVNLFERTLQKLVRQLVVTKDNLRDALKGRDRIYLLQLISHLKLLHDLRVSGQKVVDLEVYLGIVFSEVKSVLGRKERTQKSSITEFARKKTSTCISFVLACGRFIEATLAREPLVDNLHEIYPLYTAELANEKRKASMFSSNVSVVDPGFSQAEAVEYPERAYNLFVQLPSRLTAVDITTVIEQLQLLTEEGSECKAIINELLQTYRIEAGGVPLKRLKTRAQATEFLDRLVKKFDVPPLILTTAFSIEDTITPDEIIESIVPAVASASDSSSSGGTQSLLTSFFSAVPSSASAGGSVSNSSSSGGNSSSSSGGNSSSGYGGKKRPRGGARRTRLRKNRRSHKKVRKVKKQVRKTRVQKKRSTRRL